MAKQELSQGCYLRPSEEESGTASLTSWTGSKNAVGLCLCPRSYMWSGETLKRPRGWAVFGNYVELKQKDFILLPFQPSSMADTGWSS